MSQKEMFLKEVVEKVGDKVGKQSTSERVEHFAKHGTLYLFFEMINLRQEVERLKRELSTNE
ncbi:MAG: hypothetical protein JSV05_04780 [Candidatus Bathyarchaeota archaeon]|nr:MAG: hypothetical protein JSV05_04780 [Candidatus Bathyarchaeota archaeon]